MMMSTKIYPTMNLINKEKCSVDVDDTISVASSLLDEDMQNFAPNNGVEKEGKNVSVENKDLKNNILKEVLSQVLPDDGEYDIDGMMASRAKSSKSLYIRFFKFIGIIDLDLHEAVLSGSLYHVQRAVKKILYGKDPNPMLLNQLDETGRTALSIAAKIKSDSIVEYLLENNALPDIPDENTGRTPLMYSVLSRSHDMTKILVMAGASVNFADFQSVTPLMLAATVNDVVMCKILCSNPRLLVDAVDINGWTALHYCACFGSTDAMRYILREEAANKKLRDMNKRKPIDVAKFKNHLDCVALLSVSKGQIS